MRLIIRLLSLAVAAYACYSGAITAEWKASVAIVALCALVFLVSFATKTRSSTSGSNADSSAALYTPTSNSSSSCGSDAGGGDC